MGYYEGLTEEQKHVPLKRRQDVLLIPCLLPDPI